MSDALATYPAGQTDSDNFREDGPEGAEPDASPDRVKVLNAVDWNTILADLRAVEADLIGSFQGESDLTARILDILTRIAAQEALAHGQVNSVVAGANVTVDNTDPANPIVAASGGGGGLPAFDGVMTPGVTPTLDAIPRWHKMPIGFGDISSATPFVTFLIPLPARTLITDGHMITKHSTRFLAPGLTNANIQIATASENFFYGVSNSLLDAAPNAGFFTKSNQSQLRMPDEDFERVDGLKVFFALTGANIDDLTAGVVDIWMLLSVVEDSPTVKFS